jgi:hypothetical protein
VGDRQREPLESLPRPLFFDPVGFRAGSGDDDELIGGEGAQGSSIACRGLESPISVLTLAALLTASAASRATSSASARASSTAPVSRCSREVCGGGGDDVHLGEECRILVTDDDLAGAYDGARIEGWERAIPPLRMLAGALDGVLGPGGCRFRSHRHATTVARERR